MSAAEETVLRPRNRAATENAILDAARAILAAEGFAGFGINAIARRAGCDKQLIYRYFGGLDGLAEEIGAEFGEEMAASLAPLAEPKPKTYAEMVERLVLGLADLLRGDHALQQIAAWEAAAPSPLVDRVGAARAVELNRWIEGVAAGLEPPADVDAPAINAALIAAAQSFATYGGALGAFAGLPLESDAHWRRARSALSALVRAAYEG